MDENLLAAYRHTQYRVRLARGGWAAIHVDQRLPPSLAERVGSQRWGFMTAWHPHSMPASRHRNRCAQRQLLDRLRALPDTQAIHPGIGVGNAGWGEPSLFVIGPEIEALDALAVQFGQNAYLHGVRDALARLRCMGE